MSRRGVNRVFDGLKDHWETDPDESLERGREIGRDADDDERKRRSGGRERGEREEYDEKTERTRRKYEDDYDEDRTNSRRKDESARGSRRRRRRSSSNDEKDGYDYEKKRRRGDENEENIDRSTSHHKDEDESRGRSRRKRRSSSSSDERTSKGNKYEVNDEKRERRSRSPSRKRDSGDDKYRKNDDQRRRTTTRTRNEDDGYERYNRRDTSRSYEEEDRDPRSRRAPIRRPYNNVDSPQPPTGFDYHHSQSPKPRPYQDNRNFRSRNFGGRGGGKGNYGNRTTSSRFRNSDENSFPPSTSPTYVAKTVPSPRDIQIMKMKFFAEEEVNDPNVPDYNTQYFKIEGESKNRWTSEKEKEARKKMVASKISLLERYKFEKRVVVSNVPFISDRYRKIYDDNPHLRALFTNREQFFRTHRVLGEEDRIIDFENSPRTPYRRRGRIRHTVDHWGQRKLLMSEIEFLTRYYDDSLGKGSNILIYAGAAPAGKYIPFLLELFPKLRAVLVDKSKFEMVEESERIEIINEAFTDQMAKDFGSKYAEKKNNVLFISNVLGAAADDNNNNYDDDAESVSKDMKSQETWFNLLRPHHAMMKFMLSYYPGKTRFLRGQVFFPIFTGKSSSVARMMVDGGNNISWPAPTVSYSHETYENIMFHFHSVTRSCSYFEHDVVDGEGLDHCYDCAAEIHILSEYLRRSRRVRAEEMNEKVVELSKRISRVISKGKALRTLGIDCFKDYKNFFDEIL